jgi:hypothetical protein
LQSWSNFILRLETDPETLQSAVRDVRRYGYLSASAGSFGPLVMAETTVIDSEPAASAED